MTVSSRYIIVHSCGRLALAHGLAAARRTPGTPPARVAASPELPKLLRAEIADTGSCSWLKRHSAKATRQARAMYLDMMKVEIVTETLRVSMNVDISKEWTVLAAKECK